MSTRLLLVRHGQTAYNAEVRFMGQLDIPLDETGRAQALAVSRRLADERPEAIYTSGLSRARETALAIQAAIPSHPEVRVDGRLIEGHFGEWQGKTYDQLSQNDAARLASWEADHLGVPPPGGESLADLAKRVRAVYEEIRLAHADESAIIVAHGGSLQVMMVLALGLPLSSYRQLWISNASVSELRIYETGVILYRLNDTGHFSAVQEPRVSDRPV
jgi:probable phosphoglycerate mutase